MIRSLNDYSTSDIGRQAETVAQEYLISWGMKLLQSNWRTKYCEIDLIMSKRGIVYFVEVKYRRSNQQGGGLEAISRSKQKQMQMAGQIWQNAHSYNGQISLLVVEVSGVTPIVTAVRSIDYLV